MLPRLFSKHRRPSQCARSITVPTLALLWALGIAVPAANAQDAAEADKLNDAGKKEFSEKRYLEAYRLFKRATELSPEGRFYFNVCFTLNYLERYAEAIEACEQVEPNGADAALLEKTQTVLAALRQKVPQSDPGTDPGGSADPANPTTANPTGAPPTGSDGASAMTAPPPPDVDPFAIEARAPESYQWSVGANLRLVSNVSMGQADGYDNYASGAGFMGFANFILNEPMQIGMQGYIGYTQLAEEDAFEPLEMVDIGGALFKHFRMTPNLAITPLAGLQLAFLQPEAAFDEMLLAIGVRLQAGLEWSFGPNREHVVSFAPSLNLYSAAAESNGGLYPEDYGLDHPSATFEFNIGYQYRFSTPFGAVPIFTLE